MARVRSALGIPPHGSLRGLHEHDHPQYLHRKGYEPMLADLDLGGFDLVDIKGWPGSLSGHIDRDDHQRYLLADGSRDMQFPNLLDEWHIRNSEGEVLFKALEAGQLDIGSPTNPTNLDMYLDDGSLFKGISFFSGLTQIGSIQSMADHTLNISSFYNIIFGAGVNFLKMDAAGDLTAQLRESGGLSSFVVQNKVGQTLMEVPSDGTNLTLGSSGKPCAIDAFIGAVDFRFMDGATHLGTIDKSSSDLRLQSAAGALLLRAHTEKHIRLQVDSEDEHYVYVENVGTGDAYLDVEDRILVHGSPVLTVDDDAMVFAWSGSLTSGMKFNTTALQIECLRAGTPYFLVYLDSANKGAIRLVPVATCGTTGGGVLYYNSGTNRLMCHNGTSWKTISWT